MLTRLLAGPEDELMAGRAFEGALEVVTKLAEVAFADVPVSTYNVVDNIEGWIQGIGCVGLRFNMVLCFKRRI